ncbi:MAG: LacI family DNA-binding transcriptional regulator [Bacteroidales bacterium]|nr:LacI family DNA-binding transcriptional regulator [Bacteroidales bacterium]
MKKQHITIHDIARELNISASTVSRALHNHPRISQSTRDAVQQLATSYNYQPNVMASSLRKGQSRTVGVIVPRINRNFFANVIGGMEEVLAASDYHLMICQTHEQLENEISAIKTLVNARVDAIILSISLETTDKEHIQTLIDKGIHLFFFDRIFEGINAGSVVIDDRLGAYMNVKHLLEQGYRNIMHVAGADHITIFRARKEGYIDAMAEAGIDVPPGWIMERSLIQEGGESAFLKGLELSTKPDAYFCAGDFAALGVMQAARKRGLTIPDDLGISGFANEPFTAFLNPSLTTVDQRGGEMGKIVAEMFLQCAERSSEQADCEKIVLKPELIVRNSSILNK